MEIQVLTPKYGDDSQKKVYFNDFNGDGIVSVPEWVVRAYSEKMKPEKHSLGQILATFIFAFVFPFLLGLLIGLNQ